MEGIEEASELGQPGSHTLRLSLNHVMDTSLKHIMNIKEPKRKLSGSGFQEKEAGFGM